MAFFLNRSGKQILRLTSQAAAPKPPQRLQLLSASFSTNSDINKESIPMDLTVSALKDLHSICSGFIAARNLANGIQDKPPSFDSEADLHKALEDQLQKLYAMELEKKDPDAKKPLSPEMVKACADLVDTVTGGFFKTTQEPHFIAKTDKFDFKLDRKGLHLTVNVSGLEKGQLVVYVVNDHVLVSSTVEAAPGENIHEVIKMPGGHSYDPHQVTGSIIEGGELKISFPFSEDDEIKERYFQVNVV